MLRAEGFAALEGQRVGLRHQSHRPGARRRDHDRPAATAPDVKLVALFSPEHGIRGIVDENVPSSRDEKTGLPIHSLYGETRRPTAEMLKGIDTLVIDLQDVGARFYTYISTMGYVMEEAATRKIEVVVLDRPNPINGCADRRADARRAARQLHRVLSAMPVRHGMTIGELARLFNGERGSAPSSPSIAMAGLAARRVVRRDRPAVDQPVAEHAQPDSGDALSGHRRDRVRRTSRSAAAPTRRSSRSARRGSTAPQLAAALNARQLPGMRFYPVRFTPDVEQVREGAVPGRVHGRDRSRRPASVARRHRDRRRAVADPRAGVRSRNDRGCSDRRRIRAGSAAAIRRPQSPQAGPPTKRAGACCARNI